ncbi:metalloregulator ArsR/SmtB family transcription factor [Alicyclobacillus tolerans]|uniref:ArsR/SmtB family transcription factor n=1 Tax=Alicyclobacillus tolerans TaxID=90970 RepID=UPI001F031AE8|nr:metalloregulator ArsR/SmtB family transcription factor [Alicyclobacillus tolerans]MCF8564128.1 metalloregulator ArsR/SmtB family transcription factor [Alicyclobacillus tolerans]
MPQELQSFKAEFFKALANPLRIRILELLRDGDKYVHELQEHMGVDNAVVSQQLAVLRNKQIVVGVKEGTKVMYSVKDPLLFELLDIAKRIFNNSLNDTIQMLQEINDESR